MSERVSAQHTAVAAHYDARASTYDDSAMHRALADAVADVVGEPGGLLVDVATGTGLVLRAIAARHPSAELIGVDLSPAMLEVPRRGLPGAALVRAEATSLPVSPATAAVVTCVTALHLLPEPDRASHEWARVLGKDGRLVTATFMAVGTPTRTPAGTPARPGLPQGFERRHAPYRTPEQVQAAAAGFLLDSHATWRHDGTGDQLLLCVLRRTG